MSSVVERAAHVDYEAARLGTRMLEDVDRLRAYRLFGNSDSPLSDSQEDRFCISTHWIKTHLRSRRAMERLQAEWRADIDKDQKLLHANLDGIPEATDLTGLLHLPTRGRGSYRLELTATQKLLLTNISDILERILKNLYKQPYQDTLTKLHGIVREGRDLNQNLTTNAIIKAGKKFFYKIEPEIFSESRGRNLCDAISKTLKSFKDVQHMEVDLSACADFASIQNVAWPDSENDEETDENE